MELNNKNEFFTKDLNEAAALVASNIRLIRLEQGQGFYYFVFNNKDAQNICDKFWAGELHLDNAKEFSDALRTLKDRLFARK
jgi:hypothetical protein